MSALNWHPQKCTNGKWGYWNRLTSSYEPDYKQTTYAKWLFKSIFENRCMTMTWEFILPTKYNYAENFNYGIGIITDDKGATYAINYQGKRISLYFKELHTYRAIFYGKKKESKAYSISHNTPVERIPPAQLISRPPIWASE